MRQWKALVMFDYGTDSGEQRRAEIDWVGTAEEWGVSEEKLESWTSIAYVEEVV